MKETFNLDNMNVTSSTQIRSSTLVPSNDRKSLIPTENLSDDMNLYIGLAITISAAFLVVLQGVCMKRRLFQDYSVWKLMFWVGVTGIVWTSALSFTLEDTVFTIEVEDLSLVASYAILASLHIYFPLCFEHYFLFHCGDNHGFTDCVQSDRTIHCNGSHIPWPTQYY